jgi:hypothetical protein
MKITQTLRRFAKSSAYIDSGLVAGYVLAGALFAGWIAYETRFVINPIWLGGSIMVVLLYQLMIYWLLLQYFEVDRIMTIFTLNIVSLLLIVWLVGAVAHINLPTSLPVLTWAGSVTGQSILSSDPGWVALSYSVIAVLCGTAGVTLVALVETLPGVAQLKRKLALDKIDLLIDVLLHRLSGWVLLNASAWVMLPLSLLAGLLVLVVGGAALI